MTIFAKQSILDVWQGFEYASGFLKLFYPDPKRDTQECLLYIKLIIVFTPNLEFFPNSEVMQYMEIQHSIWCLWSLFHFFHSNVPDNKFHRQKWGMLFFTCIKLVARVLVCACAITCIKWRRLFVWWLLFNFLGMFNNLSPTRIFQFSNYFNVD